MGSLRILLADDHALFRKGVANLLKARPGFEVVGEAGDGLAALAKARETKPHVILMDVGMPECNGLQATRLIKREMPDVKIIMLTVCKDDKDLFEAIKSGADGYLLKWLEPSELYAFLDGIRRGEAPIAGTLAARILQEFRQSGGRGEPAKTAEDLTQREIEIMDQVVAGATNAEIAEALSIAENTVKIHMCNILEKLHLKNRVQVAVYAVRNGLVNPPDPV